MWSGVQFLTHAYGENSVGLCAPQVSRRRLVIANGGENFVPIS
ncbi:hypothetical protein A2U01_0072009, partial [Trifolium medium]|nr:hypothetical protein [Trifolium medium]